MTLQTVATTIDPSSDEALAKSDWVLALAETSWFLKCLARAVVERGLSLALVGPLRAWAKSHPPGSIVVTDPENLLWIGSPEITALASAAMQLVQAAHQLTTCYTDHGQPCSGRQH